jgi:hypothetical protein
MADERANHEGTLHCASGHSGGRNEISIGGVFPSAVAKILGSTQPLSDWYSCSRRSPRACL